MNCSGKPDNMEKEGNAEMLTFVKYASMLTGTTSLQFVFNTVF